MLNKSLTYWLICGVCVGVVGCGNSADTSNNNQSSADDSGQQPDEQGETQDGDILPGSVDEGEACEIQYAPFDDNDFWLISSESTESEFSINITGVGSTIQSVLLASDPSTGDGCSAIMPEGAVELEGQNLTLTTSLQGSSISGAPGGQEGTVCSIDITGLIAACGDTILFVPGAVQGMDHFSVQTSGQASIDDRSIDIETLDIYVLRVPEPQDCETPMNSLAGQTWAISNSSPLDFAPIVTGPLSIQLSGGEDVIETASVLLLTEEERPAVSLHCLATAPSGMISFDGTNLSIDAELQDEGDAQSDPVPCTLTFSGSAISCKHLPEEFLGVDDVTQVFEFEGSGRYETEAGSGEITTLFLRFR